MKYRWEAGDLPGEAFQEAIEKMMSDGVPGSTRVKNAKVIPKPKQAISSPLTPLTKGMAKIRSTASGGLPAGVAPRSLSIDRDGASGFVVVLSYSVASESMGSFFESVVPNGFDLSWGMMPRPAAGK